MLHHKKKYHQDASTTSEHLATVIVKQNPTEIIRMFDTYAQDVAWDGAWKNGVPRTMEEDESKKDLQEQLDWIKIEEEESKSFKKRL